MAGLEFRILGSFEVVGPDGTLALRRPMLRKLLAILLVRANQVLSADALIEALWGGEPPASARKLLQLYVSQLRRALGTNGRIETRAPGYVFTVAPEEVDGARFERLVRDGRTALAAGNPARARRVLAQGLALWRGPALHEFADEEFARAEAMRLDELRVAAIEDRVDAELELGNHEQLVAELRVLADRFPFRDGLRRQLMLTLYRTDRQAEALECYREARRVLTDELGLEPSPELRKLQQAILVHDPVLLDFGRRRRVRADLPQPRTSLLGRSDEVAALVDLLRDHTVRLLTLTGAGGAGKTRLAIEVARALAQDFAGGAYFLELAPIRDSDLVAAALAAALGIEPAAGESTQAVLRHRLAGDELLLVLDNAEHLPDLGPLLVELLHAAPDLRLLVTSRAVLHLSGERVYPVRPLDPDPAVQLFVERARAAEPAFEPDTSETQLLREICDRLDRLPLAIELAAPRTRALSLEALHERLSQRLPLLTGGARDLPARQQTLEATLAWSYELLSVSQQRALRRLSVFAGPFTPEAAEEVADASVSTLEALLEHNLVSRHEQGRLVLLETVREYALERLADSGDGEEAHSRHARCMVRIARSASVTIEAEGPMQHGLVIRERANIAVALDWASDSGQTELGLELAAMLENYWVTNDPLEGRRRLRGLLEGARDAAGGLRAHALRAYASTGVLLGKYDDAKREYECSLAEYRAVGDTRGVAIVLQRLAVEELRRDRIESARRLAQESLALNRTIDFTKGEAVALGVVADIESNEGNDARALELLEQSADLCARVGFPWWHVRVLAGLSDLLLSRGSIGEAEARMREALPLLVQMGDRAGTVLALARFASLAARAGKAERAGRLWGAIEAECVHNPHVDWSTIRARFEPAVLAAWRPELEAARISGQHLALDEAIALAGDDDNRVTTAHLY